MRNLSCSLSPSLFSGLARVGALARSALCLLALMVFATTPAFAVQTSVAGGFSSAQNFKLSSSATSAAGGEMVQNAGSILAGIAQIFAGPVMWIVMLILFAISLYQFGQGKIQMGFMCLGACVLCGVAKAFFGYIFT